MTLPRHHPTDEHLFAYASGQMGEVKAVLVATHLAYCPACRGRVAEIEAQCGDWLEALPPEPMDLGAMDDLLARVEAELAVITQPIDPMPRRPFMEVPESAVPLPLRAWSGFDIDTRDWQEIAPGVGLSTWAREGGGSSVCLLRMDPGSTVPAHRHTAEEMLLVIKGAFSDEYGSYGIGDAITYTADTEHHAGNRGDTGCICLFLLDGELEFLDEAA
ncbi:MAG TPA: ChrR family anti-sigma-E factor [Azospirillaceae bacterium]|nr:ChrR family anti-sigma-E factor [Azospirillaceae bacterium]